MSVKDIPFHVRYGSNPGLVRIQQEGAFKEPMLIWNRDTCMKLIYDLTEAMHKAWPHQDLLNNSPYGDNSDRQSKS